MPILAEIETLESRLQETLAAAGKYTSIDDFVTAYTNSILEVLGGLNKAELGALEISDIVEQALEAASDFINVEMAAQISQSVTTVLADTATFYTARGLDVPDLRDAIARSKDVKILTDLFSTNMATMRQELRDGTIEALENELAQGLLNRADLEDLIFQFADGKAQYARTNARMIVSSYNRIGRDQVRESAGLTHGFYYGDERVSTRPFCLARIGNVYTLEAIEQMDNEQLSPVRIYAGGWNCIHSWLWVNPEWDEELQKIIQS